MRNAGFVCIEVGGGHLADTEAVLQLTEERLDASTIVVEPRELVEVALPLIRDVHVYGVVELAPELNLLPAVALVGVYGEDAVLAPPQVVALERDLSDLPGRPIEGIPVDGFPRRGFPEHALTRLGVSLAVMTKYARLS
jgi:hypothetical protein